MIISQSKENECNTLTNKQEDNTHSILYGKPYKMREKPWETASKIPLVIERTTTQPISS